MQKSLKIFTSNYHLLLSEYFYEHLNIGDSKKYIKTTTK